MYIATEPLFFYYCIFAVGLYIELVKQRLKYIRQIVDLGQ